jgi:hypothetical protein
MTKKSIKTASADVGLMFVAYNKSFETLVIKRQEQVAEFILASIRK